MAAADPTSSDPFAPGSRRAAAASCASAHAADAVRAPATGIDVTAPLSALSQLARSAAAYAAAGASLGLAAQLWGYRQLPEVVASNNAMTSADRQILVLSVIGGAAAAIALPVAYLLWKRSEAAVDAVARVGRLLTPLALAFAVPILFNWKVFRNDELTCVIVGTLFGLGLERALRVSLGAMPWERLASLARGVRAFFPRLVRWSPAVLVGGLALFFAIYFSYYTVLHHYRLQTQSWDLAIFDNMMWNLVRGKWFKASPDLGREGSHIQYHATFAAYLFAPLYALRQKADTLLVLQAVVSGAGAIPVYLATKRRLESAVAGVVMAYAYVVHAPLHGPMFYDFHFLTTAPFWIGWVLYLFDTGRRGWLVVAWLAAVLLREEQGAGLAMACFYFLVSGDRPVWAMAGGVLSAAYFILAKFVIMPAHRSAGPDRETFTWIFSGLMPSGESGFAAVLRTLVSNPLFVFKNVIEQDKITYVLKMFSPVLLLPFRHRLAWLLVLPAAVFTLLSTGYKPVVETYFQYTSNWTAYLFFAAAVAMSAWKALPDSRVRIASALGAIAVTATAMSYNHGAIFQHNTFRGGFRHVEFEVNDADRANREDLYALIAMIPRGASVAATETEAPHVSNREDCFTMRFGYDSADYLLVSLGEARSGPSHESMRTALATGRYGFMAKRGNFALWGRDKPHDNDAEGRRALGIE